MSTNALRKLGLKKKKMKLPYFYKSYKDHVTLKEVGRTHIHLFKSNFKYGLS